MKELIQRFVDFICFENFTSPQIYLMWGIGLVQILLFAFLSLLSSFFILRKFIFQNTTEEFTLRTVLGISIFSFVLTLAGLTGLIYALGILIFFFVGYIILFFIYPQAFIQSFKIFKTIFLKHKLLWILFIISSLPSLLPPVWFDETTYHLVYPLKWANQHQIYTDPSMKFPLYTFNFHQLHFIGIFLKSTTFSHLLSWLCGILATLGILTLTKRLNIWKPLRYIAALAFFFTPVVQQYLNIAYHDVPIMCFMFFSVYYLMLLYHHPDNKLFFVATGIVAAMFVGMKSSNAIFVPLFFILPLLKIKFKKLLPYFIVFSVLGVIWYLRNIIIDHDPIPPALNMMLGKEDLFWSRADYNFQMKDINPEFNWGWRWIYKFPLEMLSTGPDSPLRYWPFLGYVVIVPFSFFLVPKFKKNTGILTLFIFILTGLLIWLFLATLTRYAHFIALAAVGVALLLNEIYKFIIQRKALNKIYKATIALVCIFLMIGPFHYSVAYYKNNFNKCIPVTHQEKNDFVCWYNSPCLMDMIDKFPKYGISKNDTIYGFGSTQYKYYFVKNGYELIGDGVNRFRFSDMHHAIKNHEAKEFLNRANADYLLIDTNFTGIDPEPEKNGLTLVTRNEKYLIFKVKK